MSNVLFDKKNHGLNLNRRNNWKIFVLWYRFSYSV